MTPVPKDDEPSKDAIMIALLLHRLKVCIKISTFLDNSEEVKKKKESEYSMVPLKKGI